MKLVYPIILTPIDEGFLVYAPDLEINTHGLNLPEAMEMARDAISIWCLCQEDKKGAMPAPSALADIKCDKNDIATLVDVDISAYRRKLDNRTVRKNLTIPSWLNEQAETAKINFSQALQRALKEELKIAN